MGNRRRVTLKALLEAGVHFGHQAKRWNPKMKPYIFAERNGIHIIDLQQTVPLLASAHDFVADATSRGGKILFVGTKKQAQDVVEREAKRSGQFYVNRRWLGGTLTNFVTIRNRLRYMKQLQAEQARGAFDLLPKQEAAGKMAELERLERTLGGMRDMTQLPAAVFIIDPKREQLAVHEARRLEHSRHCRHRHELRPGRCRLPHPGQRRRHPRGPPAHRRHCRRRDRGPDPVRDRPGRPRNGQRVAGPR